MKYLLFATSIFLTASFTYCNSNNANAKNNKSEPAVQNAPASSSAGDAVFSYNLNGTKISGGKVDDNQEFNSVYINKNDDGEKFSFFLNDVLRPNTSTYDHSLKFAIPGKTGTVNLIANDDNKSVELFVDNSQDNKLIVYLNEDFTVTINNISATRVSGTFSGKLKSAQGTITGNSEITITDGKFDLPVRNVGN